MLLIQQYSVGYVILFRKKILFNTLIIKQRGLTSWHSANQLLSAGKIAGINSVLRKVCSGTCTHDGLMTQAIAIKPCKSISNKFQAHLFVMVNVLSKQNYCLSSVFIRNNTRVSCIRWRSVIKERCLLQGALISVSNCGGPVIVSFTSSADLIFT